MLSERLGERIRAARKMRGWSQRELARRIGVSAMAISKYERGLDIPGSEVLLRLAQALGVRMEFFLRPVQVTVTAPAFRKRTRLPRRVEESIIARVQDWLERYAEVESLFPSDEHPVFTLPRGWPRRIRSLDEVERAVVDLRLTWNLGLGPIENLAEVLEDRGIKVGVVDETHPDFDALTLWSNGEPVIVVRRDIPGDRERFNLAHELAHLVLDPEEGMNMEAVANRFAGAFLAPQPVVLRELGARREHLHLFELHLLKHKYGLSMQAWVFRARDVGVLSPAAAQRMFRLFRMRGWHREEPGDPYPFEEPQRMIRLVLRALSEGLISEGRAEEFLGMSLEAWQRREQEHHGEIAAFVRS